MGLKVFNTLDVAGLETAAADPVDNLFAGRVYFNTVSGQARVYNGALWADLGGFQSDIYFNKFVGAGVGYYATLAAAVAAAVSGDRILVVNNTTESTDVVISTNNLRITYQPGITSTFNGVSHANLIRVNAARIKIEGAWVSYQGTGSITSHLYLDTLCSDCHISDSMFEMQSSGYTSSAFVNVQAPVTRTWVQGKVRVGLGSVTNIESNASNSTRVELLQ